MDPSGLGGSFHVATRGVPVVMIVPRMGCSEDYGKQGHVKEGIGGTLHGL